MSYNHDNNQLFGDKSQGEHQGQYNNSNNKANEAAQLHNM